MKRKGNMQGNDMVRQKGKRKMRSKLSASKFILNNRKQAGVILLAIAVSFMAMYVVNFLVGSVEESFKPFMLEAPKHVSYVNLTGETMGLLAEDFETSEEYSEAYDAKREELMDNLRQQEGIEDVYYTQLLCASYRTVVGMMGYNFPLMEAEKIPAYLEHMGAVLTEGRLPESDGEVLVDSMVFQNHQYHIGDVFLEEYFGKSFTIVGTIQSDSMTCVGIPKGYTNCGWAMVILCDESTADAKALLAGYGIYPTDNDTVDDIVQNQKMFQQEVQDVIGSAMTILLLVVILFLSVAILVAYVSYLRSRVEEYCLYLSIGYSRGEVYGMIMREVGLLFGIGLLAGAITSVLIMFLFGKLMLDPMGTNYCYWYPDYLFLVLAAYVAIIGVLQLPILMAINGVRTIDKIEEQ